MTAVFIQGPELKISLEYKTLGHFFFNNARKYSDRICQIDGTTNEKETYGSVKVRSTRMAIALQKRGITSNDVVVMCTFNSLDSAIPLLGASYLGAKTSSLDSSLSKRQITHLLSLVTPKLVFVDEAAVDLIEESLVGADLKTEIIVFGTSKKHTTFSELMQEQEDENGFSPLDVDSDDIAIMFFSSGTTGLPKAICHSQRSFLLSIYQTYESGWRENMFHYTNFYWMTAALILGCTFKGGHARIFCRDSRAEEVFRIIQDYKVEFIFMAPILTYQLTNFGNPTKYDTSSLKAIATGGTGVSTAQVEKMNDLFKSAITTITFGMSEIGVVSGFDLETDRKITKRKIESAGKLAPGIRLKIVDCDNGAVLGPNQKGELHLYSASLMKGYYKRDSSEVFDDEGFMKTGDIGYYDEDEYIYIVERIKEMFKYQAWHIVPSSIEAVLYEHPAVEEAIVFGYPDGENGEAPAACMVLKQGATLSEEDVDAFLKERVGDRERLRGGVTFVDTLPKTPTGKIVRNQVRNFILKNVI